eukprot:CAMPEP_0206147334 /NCGR_PEP_ID=MMETSP1473-20131121/33139_1 /ASSEMBLY_ACC=CAM_ASM_001109 /TAXON_ID=1461547 /ORGANISM="Stichococcus sp, Strain RCC1054" /LENGTH=644 /DNA_ID=CAMNT_0053544227 /DNA_START=61 /DNA_END=1991 /DNA_ORIENTATION=-
MSEDSEVAMDSEDAESEPEGHPSDTLIIAKAAQRNKKRHHALLEAEDSESERSEDAVSAKKARKAAKRAAKAAAAAALQAADATPGGSKASASPAALAAAAEQVEIEEGHNVVAGATPAATPAADASAGSKAAKRAAKAKMLASLLSPDNAAEMRKPISSPSATANTPAERSPGRTNGAVTAATPSTVGTTTMVGTPVRPDAPGQATELATPKPTYPAFGTSAAAAAAALAASQASGKADTPLVSNLPGTGSAHERSRSVGGAGASTGGGLLLSQVMQDLRSTPSQDPASGLSSQSAGNGNSSVSGGNSGGSKPGSAESLADLGISTPVGQSGRNRGGGKSSSAGGVKSRLGGPPRDESERQLWPKGVIVIEDDAVPENNSAMKKLLRQPRYFDDEFADSAMKCYRCGQSGHKAHECTNEAKAKPCALCAKFGHTKKDCPSLVCFKCNRNGHIASDCPNTGARVASESSEVCLRCGSVRCPGVVDHVRAAGGCTGRYSKSDLARTRCYICGHLGHPCCEDVPTTSWRPSCHNCGEGGHVGGDCKRHVPPGVRNERNPHYRAPPTAALYDDGGFDSFGGMAAIECYSCGEYGHMSRDCPLQGGGRGGGSGGGGGGGCYTCGGFGHLARDCPQKAYAPRGGSGGGG